MPREVFESDQDAGDRFRQAMSLFPSGAVIVTTSDEEGSWWGFTATSFCSLSLHPPLVLVCLATDAQCHPAFSAAHSWAVNVLPADQSNLALWFATKGVDKFSGGEFVANRRGDPVLTGACAVLECTTVTRHAGGDHSILIGRVADARIHHEQPAVYCRREVHALSPLRGPRSHSLTPTGRTNR